MGKEQVMYSRRSFIHAMGIGAITAPYVAFHPGPGVTKQELPFGFPAQDQQSVKEIVSAAHGRLDDVKRLVEARPALAKASWDWGFGDWESALGAACHMGRRDIAQVLIDHGARPTLFTHVLMGNIETLRSAVNEQSNIQNIRGPHGITLMRHAQIAANSKSLNSDEKTVMQDMIAFLEDIGGADLAQQDNGISESESKVYIGDYRFGDGAEDYFRIELGRRGNLYLSKAEQIGRTLGRVDKHSFAPFGAEAVRIHFNVESGTATSLAIHDPEPLITALRI